MKFILLIISFFYFISCSFAAIIFTNSAYQLAIEAEFNKEHLEKLYPYIDLQKFINQFIVPGSCTSNELTKDVFIRIFSEPDIKRCTIKKELFNPYILEEGERRKFYLPIKSNTTDEFSKVLQKYCKIISIFTLMIKN
ncbi:MAG: hypothetical protein QE271_14185 [Bacteriovoracaceae bacterium]|nr:hypothetical protein [Bacteriovoracaceae bacterium]